MGLFSRLKGQTGTARTETPAVLYEGDQSLEVVGESFHQDALVAIAKSHGGRLADGVRVEIMATLLADPTNPYDPNAVGVWIEGNLVGHLSRRDAAVFQPVVMRLTEAHGYVVVRGEIVGGGMYADGPGRLGVFLRYSPEGFGIPNPHARTAQTSMRTGLSNAIATDLADDSYDLAWMVGLSSAPSRRVSQLRILLADEIDPVSRHFMYSALEADLYSLRDLTPALLDEYDAACKAHDADMVLIRPALIAKFNVLPLLETYRKMAVRQQKAKNYEQALRWAQRGLEVYGEQASNPDWVEDLQHRAAKYWEKVHPTPRAARTSSTSGTGSLLESLTCAGCGVIWERPVTRGRKPHRCPDCAAASAPV